jgi:hypothetical protein
MLNTVQFVRSATLLCLGVLWIVLEAGVCPYFLAVPNHGHVLRSRVLDLCLFLDISDIMDLFRTFVFQTPALLDRLCSLWVA